MFISPAYAQAAQGPSVLGSLLPFVLIFAVFYLFLIRPQQKRAKQHKEMVDALRRGDKVTTAGGLKGTVAKAVDGQDTIEVEIAKDVKVTVVRSMVSAIETKDGASEKPAGK